MTLFGPHKYRYYAMNVPNLTLGIENGVSAISDANIPSHRYGTGNTCSTTSQVMISQT